VVRRAPYGANSVRGSRLYRINVDTGEATLLMNETEINEQTDLHLSPDGNYLLFWRIVPDKPVTHEIWRLDLMKGQSAFLLQADEARWIP
jgi:hypothetical protein